MKREIDEDELPWPYQYDHFDSEREDFERDVHLLILRSLAAGITSLRQGAQAQEDKLPSELSGLSEDYQEHIIGEAADIWGYLGDQERFLRNMALVALLSRLTHALNKMAKDAETFVFRRKEGYGKGDEFKRLKSEYKARFDVSLKGYIEFADPLRKARNLIVHNGGEANSPKPIEEMDFSSGDEGLYNTKFSKAYKHYVEGTGSLAVVRVTQEQLEDAFQKSLALVSYVAAQLRAKELEHVRAGGTTPYDPYADRPKGALLAVALIAGSAMILTYACRAWLSASQACLPGDTPDDRT